MSKVSADNDTPHADGRRHAGQPDRRTEAGVRPADPVRRAAGDRGPDTAGVRAALGPAAAAAFARYVAGRPGRVRPRTAGAVDKNRPRTAAALLRRTGPKEGGPFEPPGDLVLPPADLAAGTCPAGGGHG